MPDMMVGLYDQVLAFDHHKNRAWFITHADSEDQAQARLHHLRKLTDHAPVIEPRSAGADFAPELMRHEYEDRIARVIEYVHAGDIFQANLSQRFVADMPRGFDSFAHYLHLRDISPAPFASYMNFGTIKLASASPERFIKVQNWQVEARPIKGTMPRHADPQQDTRAAEALQNSAKDYAENAMIVDLLRNDLSKVCHDHSVEVPVLCGLESFAQVHHLVSVVKGMLNANNRPLDLLRACFPGGSVTGAPKVRAMQIIEALEDNRRGPYCGALGYIGIGDMMDTNIVIRTLVHNGRRTCFNVGGGIVADSNPAAEYDETLTKAQGLLKSFDKPIQESEALARATIRRHRGA
jgi:para-aminobenzoate synthetase component 1